jgi:hypothetical protein
MRFEYVNPSDLNRSIPGKNSMTKYDRRREIIELRKLIVQLNKQFPDILNPEDVIKISKLSTCENRRYLINLLAVLANMLGKDVIGDFINGSTDTGTGIREIIRDL